MESSKARCGKRQRETAHAHTHRKRKEEGSDKKESERSWKTQERERGRARAHYRVGWEGVKAASHRMRVLPPFLFPQLSPPPPQHPFSFGGTRRLRLVCSSATSPTPTHTVRRLEAFSSYLYVCEYVDAIHRERRQKCTAAASLPPSTLHPSFVAVKTRKPTRAHTHTHKYKRKNKVKSSSALQDAASFGSK
jgi:hypothetical protein